MASYDNLEWRICNLTEETPRPLPRPLPVKPPVDQDEYMAPVVEVGPSGNRETAPSPVDRAEREEPRVVKPLVRRYGVGLPCLYC